MVIRRRSHGLELKGVVRVAARETTIPQWDKAVHGMKALNESGWNDVSETPAQYWSILHFKIYTKCDL